MIVKNEAHVIERCLASVRPFIDAWVIVDTGSSDGTQDLIRRALADLPGALYERPWVNFGHNRSEALALAQQQASAQGDYLLMIDADEVLRLPAGYQRPPLRAEAYDLTVEFAGIHYARTCLINSSLPWRWMGVLHEYLDAGRMVAIEPLPGPTVQVFTDGARSQRDEAEKYAADAQTLEAALQTEPDNSRYVFYLAQSYRDSRQPAAALARYRQRAAMGGWIEEVWYSRYQAALLAEQLGHAPAEVMQAFLEAYECRPERGGEALGQLARYCRGRNQFASARLFATQAMTTPLPEDRLFVDPSWYRWRSQDEYAVASYWTGHYAESRRVCEALLAGTDLPAQERARVQANLDFAIQKLGA
jgi:Glycosyl transferase family 2